MIKQNKKKRRLLPKALLGIFRNSESILGDLLIGTNTSGSVYYKQPSGINLDARNFEPISHTGILKAIWRLKLLENDTVCVLGCGKGRALCHLARQKVRKVVGIELAKGLAEIAIDNAKRSRGRRAPVEVRNEDAAISDYSDCNVFFLFNPFGAATLRAVLERIEASRNHTNSCVRILYLYAVEASVFEGFPWLKPVDEYYRLNGMRVIVYCGSKHESK